MSMDFSKLFEYLLEIMNLTIYIIIGLAVMGFLWGIVKMLFNSDNEIAKKEGRNYMMYGILTIFVMTSFWGLVNILNGSLTLEGGYVGDVNYEESGVELNDNAQMI